MSKRELPAIVSVTTADGNVLFHTKKGLVSYELAKYATRFKSVEHACKLARRKYSPLLRQSMPDDRPFVLKDCKAFALTGWAAHSLTEEYAQYLGMAGNTDLAGPS